MMNTENAEILALQGLGWLAGDEEALQRFLDLSGQDVGALRAQAGTSDMNIAVLDFLLGHEDLLVRFCEASGISPRDMHLARHRLGGEV
jgi:Protein of unknown function (DUF3572)